MIKKLLLLAFTFLILDNPASSQIAKGNWLWGGNINFSSNKRTNDMGGSTNTTFQTAGNAGYFFIDKLASGIKPNISISSSVGGEVSSQYSIGPFVKYYVLSSDAITNLFIEASYSYGILSGSQQTWHSNSYSFLAGPEFFINPSVGIELSVGYSLTKTMYGVNNQSSTIQLGIGLQFHLEKK